MQRRLIVMRHAKSSWSSGAATDHERPLNARGQQEAPRVGVRLAELGWTPQWVLSSDSLRTRETWGGMADHLPTELTLCFTRRLYAAGLAELRREASGVPDDVTTLLALGHNPGWEEVVWMLTGEQVPLKTANAALLSGQGISWHESLQGNGRWQVVDVIRPREL